MWSVEWGCGRAFSAALRINRARLWKQWEATAVSKVLEIPMDSRLKRSEGGIKREGSERGCGWTWERLGIELSMLGFLFSFDIFPLTTLPTPGMSNAFLCVKWPLTTSCTFPLSQCMAVRWSDSLCNSYLTHVFSGRLRAPCGQVPCVPVNKHCCAPRTWRVVGTQQVLLVHRQAWMKEKVLGW